MQTTEVSSWVYREGCDIVTTTCGCGGGSCNSYFMQVAIWPFLSYMGYTVWSTLHFILEVGGSGLEQHFRFYSFNFPSLGNQIHRVNAINFPL